MKTVVVGAGIAGLGAATKLRHAGHEVTVLEATSRVGGRARTLTSRRGDRCDVGTQYYHSSYRRALGLMREVGLDRSVSRIAGSTRFFDGRARDGSFLVHHRLPWFSVAGLSGNVQMLRFLLGSVLRHRMDPFALEDLPELDRRSAWEAAPTEAQRDFMVRTLFLVGTLADPRAVSPSHYQLLRLLRIIVLTDYLVLPGGVCSLHEALASRLSVRLESPVKSLVVERERVRGVELATGEVVPADHVVVATEAPCAASLLPADWTEERTFLAGVELLPALIVSFFLDRRLEARVWSYFAPANGTGFISFVTDALEKSPAMVPSGRSVLQAWVCWPAAKDLIAKDDSSVIDTCGSELDDYFPGFRSWVEEAYVTRHARSATQHPVGHHGKALGFLAAAERRAGVTFCGDYFSGGYLEPALWSVERSLARI